MALKQWTITFLYLTYTGLTLIAHVDCQEEFSGPIVCYYCYDKAVNTTCGEPNVPDDLEDFNTINCKRGACVKWTFYEHSVLMIRRTCSEKVNMHIPLNQVCRTERNGNGYICMCAKDQCNSGQKQTFHVIYTLLPLSLLLKLVFSGS